jgi:hypothetical protein
MSTPGQATVEFVGVLPLLALAALAVLQGFLIALTAIFASTAAGTAGHGQLPIPQPWRRSARVTKHPHSVELSLAVPMVIPVHSVRLHARRSA